MSVHMLIDEDDGKIPHPNKFYPPHNTHVKQNVVFALFFSIGYYTSVFPPLFWFFFPSIESLLLNKSSIESNKESQLTFLHFSFYPTFIFIHFLF